MNRFNITAKIWLSIGIFIVGFLISVVLGQIQGLTTESTLRVTSEGLFPAAQRSQEAEAGFEKVEKALGDAVLVQDASGLDRAGEEGRRVVEALKSLTGNKALAVERSRECSKVAASVEQFLSDARST